MNDGQRALIVGGTGFIGGRLAEILTAEGITVRVLARRFSTAARVARLPVQMLLGDMADKDAMLKASDGASCIYFCAFDDRERRRNVAAARLLAELTADRGLPAVYLSSISVYEPLPPSGRIDESSPQGAAVSLYAEMKREAEKALLERSVQVGGNVVILQPTVVYGPYAGAWTVGIINELLAGPVFLPDKGEGLANLVHVDDVCTSMRAAVSSNAYNDPMLISGPEVVTWGELYAGFAKAIDHGEIRYTHSNMSTKRAISAVQDPKLIVRRLVPRRLAPKLKTLLSPSMKAAIKGSYRFYRGLIGDAWQVPDQMRWEFQASRARVSTDKAKRMLGWQPEVRLEDGLSAAYAFARWWVGRDA